jgi:hypothetical protein
MMTVFGDISPFFCENIAAFHKNVINIHSTARMADI